ncbi:MAG: uridine kinase [Elusimicrobiota bacterium]
MPETKPETAPRVILGIAGGSGSGKSWLAKTVAETFADRAAVVCHDWYYKHNGHMSDEEARLKLNFDHPSSLETSLMGRHLDRLAAGEPVDAPIYEYATHARLKKTRRVEPKPLLIIDGILILHEKILRDLMTLSVFIDVPDDIRLMRRVKRDCTERGVELDETLRLYEDFVRPMHHRYVAPSSRHATWIWSQMDDKKFPDLLIQDLRRRLDDKVPA